VLLTVNIGNTNISLGLFRLRRLEGRFIIPTGSNRDYSLHLKKVLAGNKIREAVVISSVAPDVTRVLAGELKKVCAAPIYNIGKDIAVPIRNLYRDPKRVGSDRLVNAYAGVMLYGAPLIIVDFGTAITFDLVSKNKEYMGGMVLPGLRTSLSALHLRTALLPEVALGKPREFIGRDTKAGILSGIIYGFASLTDGMIGRIKDEIGRSAKVIATGGDVCFIGDYCSRINRVDRDLTLKGLELLYRNRKGGTEKKKNP